MQNLSFLVFARPVVDKNKQTRYLKLKVVKKTGTEEKPLQKGAILHFIASNFEILEKHLKGNIKFLFDLPFDFLVSRSIIEGLKLKKLTIVATEPVGKVTPKLIFEIKEFITDYLENGLELGIHCSIYLKYGLKLGKEKFSFICTEYGENCPYSSLCFKKVDNEEIFQAVKDRGILFCGKLFGEYRLLEEITALNYLQNTIERVLELLSSNDASAADLEQIIKTDPKLSIAILKYANSPIVAPLKEIKDLRHAIVYLGFNRLKDFLVTFLVNQLATVDKGLYELALQLSAAGFLMERYGSFYPGYSKCEYFLAGVIYEFSKIMGRDPKSVYETLSPPKGCERVITDPRLYQIYKKIREEEKLKMKENLKKIFA